MAQPFADFELVISNNASTDGAARICREWAVCDRRIRCIRQPVNGSKRPEIRVHP